MLIPHYQFHLVVVNHQQLKYYAVNQKNFHSGTSGRGLLSSANLSSLISIDGNSIDNANYPKSNLVNHNNSKNVSLDSNTVSPTSTTIITTTQPRSNLKI
ncbi:hypothetical protein ACTFIW_011134 [Dictyostelium discoideum]